MAKFYFRALILGLLLFNFSNIQAESREECLGPCRAGGMACMRACTTIFHDDKKCGEICEYGDRTCTKYCLEIACKKECKKIGETPSNIKKCEENCEEEDGSRLQGIPKNW